MSLREQTPETRHYRAYTTAMGDDYIDGLIALARTVHETIKEMGLPRNAACLEFIARQCFDFVCTGHKDYKRIFGDRTDLNHLREKFPDRQNSTPLGEELKDIFQSIHLYGDDEERNQLARAYAAHEVDKLRQNSQDLTQENAQRINDHILAHHMDFIVYVCSGTAQHALADKNCCNYADLGLDGPLGVTARYEVLLMDMSEQLGHDVAAELDRLFKRDKIQAPKPGGPA